MGLYTGFFLNGGMLALKGAIADVDLCGDISFVGILAYQADDAELGEVKIFDFQASSKAGPIV